MTKTKAVGQSPALLLGAIDLPGNTASVPAARTYVQQLLTGLDIGRLHIVLLLVSELTANSIRHSDSGRNPNGRVRVEVTVEDGVVNVDVIDEGSATSTPHIRAQMNVPAPDGYGLQLVDQLADDWGHHEVDGGRVVWFQSDPPWPEPEVPKNAKSGERPTWTGITGELSSDGTAELASNYGLPRPLTSPKREAAPGTGGGTPSPSAQAGGSRKAPIAVRRQAVIDRLAEQIAAGELAKGARLPSIPELMDSCGIPGSAARFIQRELRDRRLVRLVPGRCYLIGAPDETPALPRTHVQDRITEICTELVAKIRRGEIRPRTRVASQRQLMKDYGVSRYAAQAILSRLLGRGWAYENTDNGGAYAAPIGDWPPPDTSLAPPPIPADHVPKCRLPKAGRAPPPDTESKPNGHGRHRPAETERPPRGNQSSMAPPQGVLAIIDG
ncbi:ATP-binding protein [Acrocarpospora sp. B8E8]|uniref:ATP-binding protein n=1 Tax=Acrocarpospora sp. B8E8 TaxID=3153572 RepID=UPI00325C44C8